MNTDCFKNKPATDRDFCLLRCRMTHFYFLELNGTDKGAESEDEHEPEYYNKTKSFFDNISCEAADRAEGYVKLSQLLIELVHRILCLGVCLGGRTFSDFMWGGKVIGGCYLALPMTRMSAWFQAVQNTLS